MTIGLLITVYVLGILLQLTLSLIKPKFLGFLPPIASSIAFLCSREINLLILAFIQTGILAVCLLATYVVGRLASKKKLSEVEKTKIKDL